MFYNTRPNLNAKVANINVIQLQEFYRELSNYIILLQLYITALRYKTNKTRPQLKEGDKVYLLTKNLKTRKRSKKLDYIKVGLFLITE